jgi:diguanylate cyclase (GGDEF)-like protein
VSESETGSARIGPGSEPAPPHASRIDRRTRVRLLIRRRGSLWATGAAVLLVFAGVLGAVFGAQTVASSDAQRQRLASHLTAAEIASVLKLAIRREEDLTISTSAFVANNPNVTPAAFDRWIESMLAIERYPELQNIGLVKRVGASQLKAFEAHEATDPLRPLGPTSVPPSGGFQLLPAGRRPYYCLAVAGMASDAAAVVPQGLDYCALISAMVGTRDSGLTGYAPLAEAGTTGLGVSTPVYRTRFKPSTAQGRRQAFLGWLGERIQPRVLLQTALIGHPGAAVVFRFNASDSHVAFASGTPPAGAQSTTIPVALGREAGLQRDEGWTMESYSASISASVFSNRNALLVLVGGSLLSVLIGLLLSVLGTGRTRARALVREKTRELSEKNRELFALALHDPLTGLPNRSLVLDRAERMLARSARDPDVIAAALYVDVDRFKDVNDSLGHAAGDRLLTVVGERLQSAVRDQDTVGRLGGDEFIVLVDSSTDEAALESLANRMIQLLREPIDIGGASATMSVTVSIGLAVGRYETADQLLRDADLALYAAKAAGKDRCTVFDASLHPNGGDPALRPLRLGDQSEQRHVSQPMGRG